MSNGSLEKYLDSKFKNSEIIQTSPDFTGNLLNRIRTDYSFESELKRSDRTATLVIGFFASLMVLMALVVGYVYIAVNPSDAYRIGSLFGNSAETIAGYVRQLTSILSSPITFAIILSSFIYYFADQFLVAHKKSKGL